MSILHTFKALRNRLGSSGGETIAETLVAILVSSLAMLMMATAIGAASKAIRTSRSAMDEMYASENSMVEQATSSSNSSGSTSTLGSIEFAIPLELDEFDNPKDIDVVAYKEENGQSAFYEKRQ